MKRTILAMMSKMLALEIKNETDDKTGKYNDVDDDQTFESSGKVSKGAPHQADQRVVS